MAASCRASTRATSNPVNPGICTSRNTRSGRELLDGLERLGPVARLPDDLDAADLVEQIAQLVACELLVVHDERAEVAARTDRAAVPCQALARTSLAMSGISILTDVPSPGVLFSLSWQCSP